MNEQQMIDPAVLEQMQGLIESKPKQRVVVHEQQPISDHDKGPHKGHRVRRKGNGTHFRCEDCNVTWQMKRNTAIARARLLR